MRTNLLETIMGAIVLVIAAVILIFAYTSRNAAKLNGAYELTAKFDRVDGLLKGSDVRVSGIKVGTVTTETLDPSTFLAIVTISVNSDIKLPVDTSAEVVSEGLLGGKYLALVPGGSDDIIQHGGEIKYTQAAISIESLIGQYIFSQDKKKDDETDNDNPSP
ncbi:MAG: outer membrane lipid asymmetry maintenance protein MlaD [Alphaproteobacteria bacterium]|jgi:phospholipid/cholesterol/gamma-HCH transport system substrate-binding protein|nr:outer membrane lipid asymmetry maintenance protein MlaD [Alphaproteobacteria bacterium]MBT5389820.1 outer membrane lipid asymmetry maintenance protein MlaD [Alphaproteobacteria bacterium]MBT5541159.1 outer membrane lipid asymmetry maintenance protein MlaD [Alphaproteobacteria bacterium]MBT5654382.1 outer membrane lipid asymmetry maintenance protein MlaD [Alphaproteobacteria bacterium]